MSAFAPMMVAASAAIIFTLGIIHLVYTFRGIVLATILYSLGLLAQLN